MKTIEIERIINVTESQKDKQWISDTATYIYQESINNVEAKKMDVESWNLYNKKIDQHSYDYLRKYGDYELPAFVRFIPIQRHFLDILKAQQERRRLPMSVYITDEELVRQKHTESIRAKLSAAILQHQRTHGQYDAIMQGIQQQMQELQQMAQKEPESQEEAEQLMQLKKQLPFVMNEMNAMLLAYEREKKVKEVDIQKIEKYYKREYKDHKEIVAQKLKTKLEKELRIKTKTTNAFVDQIVTGKHYYYVDYEDGQRLPTFKNINDLKVYYPQIDNVEFVHEGPWVMILDYYSYTDVVKLYGKDIKEEHGEETLKNIGEYGSYTSNYNQMLSGSNGEGYFVDGSLMNGYAGTSWTGNGISVAKVFYKSNRDVYVKKSPNPFQQRDYFTHIISPHKSLIRKEDYYFKNGYYINKRNKQETYFKDEVITYSDTKGEKKECYTVQDVYEAVIIAGEYVIRQRKKKHIRRDQNNLSLAHLPVFGRSFNNLTEEPYSLIQYTKDIQELYNIVNYHRELLLAISGGKGTVVDYSQKPPQMDQTEWEYNMKIGNLYINTVDSNGRPINPSYNQWKNYDNTVSPVVVQLTQILQELEETMGRIIGVNRQMLGQVVASDQVGTSRQALDQSQLIVEPLFYECDLILSYALTDLLNHAINNCFKPGEIVSIFYDDLDNEVIEIPEGLNSFSYRAMVIDSPYQLNQLNELRTAMMQLTMNGAMPLRGIIDGYKIETLKELEEKFVEYDEKREKAQQMESEAQREHEQNINQLREQMKMQIEEGKRQVDQMKLQVEKEKNDINAQIKMLELDLLSKKQQDEVNLKMLELTNEQRTETALMNQNKELTLNEQKLKEFQIKLDYMFKMISLGVNAEREVQTKKLDMETKLYGAKNKEHVSDR